MVRWTPNELSFSSAEAWRDIYTPHKPGETFVKDPGFYLIDDTYVFNPFIFENREYIDLAIMKSSSENDCEYIRPRGTQTSSKNVSTYIGV